MSSCMVSTSSDTLIDVCCEWMSHQCTRCDVKIWAILQKFLFQRLQIRVDQFIDDFTEYCFTILNTKIDSVGIMAYRQEVTFFIQRLRHPSKTDNNPRICMYKKMRVVGRDPPEMSSRPPGYKPLYYSISGLMRTQ